MHLGMSEVRYGHHRELQALRRMNCHHANGP